jgi:hypothetical protein
MSLPQPKVYLHNKDLYIEIIISKATGKLTPRAKIMLELLAKRTIKKMRYYNSDDRDDCMQGGLLDIFSNWYSFNSDKSDNCFSYFTEVFKRGTAKTWNTLFSKKGDSEHKIKLISIESSNDGMGLHSI